MARWVTKPIFSTVLLCGQMSSGASRSSVACAFAVEHVLGMLAAGDTPEVILREYSMLEPEDIRACLCFAYRSMVGDQVHERLPIRRGT